MNQILFIILVFTVLALAFGVLLGYAAIRFKVESDPIVEKLDAVSEFHIS